VALEKVYLQAIGNEGLPSSYGRSRHHSPHVIRTSRAFINILNDKGFRELNAVLEPSINTMSEMAERLKEAILWFGRGVASEQMADSLLSHVTQ
jgi:hypothetical protein